MDVEELLHQRLSALQPIELMIENESHMHNVPDNSETHFKVVIVSSVFKGVRPVQRHQKVYQAVGDLMRSPIHALALHTFTSEEWELREGGSQSSPPCMGGDK